MSPRPSSSHLDAWTVGVCARRDPTDHSSINADEIFSNLNANHGELAYSPLETGFPHAKARHHETEDPAAAGQPAPPRGSTGHGRYAPLEMMTPCRLTRDVTSNCAMTRVTVAQSVPWHTSPHGGDRAGAAIRRQPQPPWTPQHLHGSSSVWPPPATAINSSERKGRRRTAPASDESPVRRQLPQRGSRHGGAALTC